MAQANLAEYRSTWCIPAYDIRRWHGRSTEYCVIIPVINEGIRLHDLLKRIQDQNIDKLADVIIVDGGSQDGSLDLDRLDAYGVRGLLVKTGAGKLSAQLRCAYAFALDQGYEGIVTIDGNNKDDPEAITRFVDALRNDAIDFVQASRFVLGGEARNTPMSRNFAIRFIHAPALSWASGFKWTDTTQGFRAYSRRLLLDPRIAPFREIFSSYELLAYLNYRAPQLGFKCVELPTRRIYPEGEVPTKISSVRGNLHVLKILLDVCRAKYNA